MRLFTKKEKKIRDPKYYEVLIFWGLVIFVLFSCIALFNSSPEFPLFLSVFIAIAFAFRLGYTWENIINHIVGGVKQSVEAILILMCIGMIISLWVASSTIPTLIYYGLQVLKPQYFLIATYIICLAISMAIGAWGCMGTIGLSIFIVGQTCQINSVFLVGAIVSGAYIGEVISPLSDAPNLSASVCKCNLFSMIKKSLKPTIIAVFVSIIFYITIDLVFNSQIEFSNENPEILSILNLLNENFNINVLSLLPVAVLLVLLLYKMPSLISMFISILVSLIMGIIINGYNLDILLSFTVDGFCVNSVNEQFNSMLNIGGINSMVEVICIAVIALSLGGITQNTNISTVFIKPFVDKAKSNRFLQSLTTFTAFIVNIILPDQYLGITMTGNAFIKEYENRHIEYDTFAKTVITGAATTSSLIPWNTCGIFIVSLFGIPTLEYAPFAIFVFALPIVSIILSLIQKNK